MLFACRRGGNPVGQAFADFLGWKGSPAFGVSQTLINGTKSVLVLVLIIGNEGRILKLKFAGFGHE